MKRIFSLIILLFLISHNSAEARPEIVAIQSARVAPYEEAIKGFESVCNVTLKRLVSAELKGTDPVQKINEIRPDMVVAIGMSALEKAKRIKNIPILYLMVLNPQSILSGEKNISGISMNISTILYF